MNGLHQSTIYARQHHYHATRKSTRASTTTMRPGNLRAPAPLLRDQEIFSMIIEWLKMTTGLRLNKISDKFIY